MADVLLWFLNLAWKVLALAAGWILFKYVLRNGKGAFKELLETIGLMMRAGCTLLRKKLIQLLDRETAKDNQDDQVKVEGTVV